MKFSQHNTWSSSPVLETQVPSHSLKSRLLPVTPDGGQTPLLLPLPLGAGGLWLSASSSLCCLWPYTSHHWYPDDAESPGFKDPRKPRLCPLLTCDIFSSYIPLSLCRTFSKPGLLSLNPHQAPTYSGQVTNLPPVFSLKKEWCCFLQEPSQKRIPDKLNS